MKINSKPFTQIDREYILSSAELRKALKLKGEIINIGLYAGRSPDDIEKGKSSDKDLWYIKSTEITNIENANKTNL